MPPPARELPPDTRLREGWREVLAEGRWAVLLLICAGIWLHAADSLVVATTLPSVVASVGGIEWVGWSLALYEIGSIVFGALGGLIASRRGVGFAVGLSAAAFGAGCVLSGLADSMGVFLLGRGVQGAGGGAMVSLCHIAVTRAFPERHWTRIYAVVSAVWGASALVGPLVGGLFAEAGIWRWAYHSFAIQAVAVVLLAPRLLGRRERAQGGQRSQGGAPVDARVPWAALAVLTPAVLAIAAAGVTESSALAALAVIGGAALMAWFLRLDRRAPNALLPHGSLRRPRVAAGLVLVLAFSTATTSFTLYGPLLMAGLHGIGPLTAGYLVAVESVAWSLAALSVSGVGPAGEGRWLRTGGLCIVLGIGSFAVTVSQGPVWAIGLSALLTGGGFGFIWSFLVRRMVAASLAGERERTAGAVPVLQMLGYALGAAFAGIVANAQGLGSAQGAGELAPIALWLFLAFVPLTLIGLFAAFRVAR